MEIMYNNSIKHGGDITNELYQVEQKTKEQLEQVERFLAKAPEGILKVQTRKGRDYYTRQYQTKDKIQMREYIRKKDIDSISIMAQKEYYIKLKPILESQLKAIQLAISKYDEKHISKIYNSISAKKQPFVKPITSSIDEIIKEWKEEVYEHNQSYPENLTKHTDQGEMVRSKSEEIIANKLYTHKHEILYKYERPLVLYSGGKEVIIHPDFTILNLKTGKIVYLEHSGRVDDPRYAQDMVKRINLYSENGINLGTNLFFTFETYHNPVNIHHVNGIIQTILQQ